MERERITISIRKDLLGEVDRVIDKINVRNRSHAFEFLSRKALNLEESKNAVILIGGDDAPKAIPHVESWLGKLADSGFKKAYIAVGYLAEKIKEKLGDGSKYNIEINYLTEGEGSGGVILPLKKKFNKHFLVIDATKELTVDLKFLYDFHKHHAALATTATDNLSDPRGIYIFEPEVFKYIPKGFSMLDSDVCPKLAEEGKLVVYPIFD